MKSTARGKAMMWNFVNCVFVCEQNSDTWSTNGMHVCWKCRCSWWTSSVDRCRFLHIPYYYLWVFVGGNSTHTHNQFCFASNMPHFPRLQPSSTPYIFHSTKQIRECSTVIHFTEKSCCFVVDSICIQTYSHTQSAHSESVRHSLTGPAKKLVFSASKKRFSCHFLCHQLYHSCIR